MCKLDIVFTRVDRCCIVVGSSGDGEPPQKQVKVNAKTMALALAHDSIIHCRGDSSTDVGDKDGDI